MNTTSLFVELIVITSYERMVEFLRRKEKSIAADTEIRD
jgi:hypothetical protein